MLVCYLYYDYADLFYIGFDRIFPNLAVKILTPQNLKKIISYQVAHLLDGLVIYLAQKLNILQLYAIQIKVLKFLSPLIKS